ncbi:HEAT repeat domain-containing protein [Candidatus Cyanaurora vandensis]|uniref:HEAT repeat domain-containing protein n=1 Tax=Candidatus Cyanaurora vandensis TaxID=2714958 RepID=UPI00257B7530|nr:HEAT repeat domain-containing protein [Candidatus Cyanaurora vandensis]
MNDLLTQLQDPDFKRRVQALLTLRNATPEEVAPLAAVTIRDEHVQMRSYTCMLLGKKPSETAFTLLIQALQADLDQGVRADAAGALGALQDPRAWEYLARAYYEDTEWIVQYSALVSLGNLADPRAYDLFVTALQSKNELMEQAAIGALGEVGQARAIPWLLPYIESSDWLVRLKVAIALAEIAKASSDPETAKAREALRYLAQDPHPQIAAVVKDLLER